MNSARERIFAKLHSAASQNAFSVAKPEAMPSENLDQDGKIEKLKRLMETVHAEVHIVDAVNWVDKIKQIVLRRKLNYLLYGLSTKISQHLEQAWENAAEKLPPLTPYNRAIEQFKETLFTIDASITSTEGGIADSGALILWPTEQEPRLMSLVPPIHIAILEADKIYNSFSEAIEIQGWQYNMPTNAVLISGPSKTADIELTLAFGVHGPKELIVLILKR